MSPRQLDVESGCGDVSSPQHDVADAGDFRSWSIARVEVGDISRIAQRCSPGTSPGEESSYPDDAGRTVGHFSVDAQPLSEPIGDTQGVTPVASARVPGAPGPIDRPSRLEASDDVAARYHSRSSAIAHAS